ncbi:hypothetical protein VS868_11695 [Salinimicrobium sp. 3283s]|uniref:hypothetical protein n=1 Tax=Salinimicrobium sp. 3283s TaxID=3114359 RepID=UPI0031EC7161
MKTTQGIVSVLFEYDTLKKAKAQFKSGAEKTPIDSQDLSFRLLKTKYGNINLELLCRDNSGMYFKPVGFYEFEKGGFFSSGKLVVTVLNEFQEDYNSWSGTVPKNVLKVKFMNIRESGIIAAFSRETIETVKEMYRLKTKGLPQSVIDQIGPFPHLHAMQFDKSLNSNGLNIDLLFSMEGFPQCFLDDDYGVQGAFGAYFKNDNGYSLNPIIEHKTNYNKFYRMGLLSAYKGI